MRNACDAASKTLATVAAEIKPGITTDYLDEVAHQTMIDLGGYPSTLNYHGYPKSCCTSINEVICHGIPDTETTLYDGDIICVDVTIYLDGMHGDLNQTFAVGQIDQQSAALVEATRKALEAGIAAVKPGGRTRDIGKAIEASVKGRYGIVHQFGGHGIGPEFHDGVHIQHNYDRSQKTKFFPGMTFTIEPMLTLGSAEAAIWPEDGWTAVTVDGSRSAQFEHTILVTDSGTEVLTSHV